MWALGLIKLSGDDPAGVDGALGPLCEQLLMFGAGDPSFIVFLPDEVEALIRLGELERAERYRESFAQSAAPLDRQWAIALAERCLGMLAVVRGDAGPASEAFDRALAAHGRAGMPFDRARTLLAAGQALRRFKQRRRAGELLDEAAAATFKRLGRPYGRSWRKTSWRASGAGSQAGTS